MIVHSITCENKGSCRKIYELRKGPKRYVGYLQDGQHVVEADNDEEAVWEFVSLFNRAESAKHPSLPGD